MAIKRVGVKLVGDDAELKRSLDSDLARIEGLKTAAGGIKLDLNDGLAKLKLRQLNFDLRKVSERIARPRVTVDGYERAAIQIDRLSLKLDELGAKSVTADVNVKRTGRLASLFSGLAGDGGGLGSFLLSPLGLLAAGGAVSALGPGILGGALGLGIPGIGAALGIGAGAAPAARIQQLRAQMATASAKRDKVLRAEIAAIQQQNGPALSAFGAFSGFKSTAESTLLSALTTPGAGQFTMRGGKPTFLAGVPSFVQGLSGMFRQLSGFVKTLGPELGAMFRASIPALRQFVTALEPAIKQAIPALTQVLQTLVKSGLMRELGQAFGLLLTGSIKMLAGMSRAFSASGAVIRFFARIVGVSLTYIGATIGHVVTFVSNLFHGRWSSAWHDALGLARAQGNLFVGFLGSWAGKIAGWANRSIQSFDHLALGAVNALRRLPAQLTAIGGMAMQGLLNGLVSVGGRVLSYISGLASKVASTFAGLLGIHSPSRVFHSFGLNIGQGLSLGLDCSRGAVSLSAGRLAMSVPNAFAGSYAPTAGRYGAASAGAATVRITAHGDDLTKAIVKALRYDIRANGTGNVQNYLGWS